MNAKLAHPSVLSREQLPAALEAHRAGGRSVVFTNGCFDILHPGHVDLLERAKAQGDILVVGLNSDSSVRRLNKGRDRPVNPEDWRAFMLAHLASVDFVVVFKEDTPMELIREIRPEVLIKGGDWPPDKIVGAEIVAAQGGRVLSLPLLGDFSSTAWLKQHRLPPEK